MGMFKLNCGAQILPKRAEMSSVEHTELYRLQAVLSESVVRGIYLENYVITMSDNARGGIRDNTTNRVPRITAVE